MIATDRRIKQTPQGSDLARRVANLLWQRSSLRRVNVFAQDGRVTLSGTVHSFYERQLCISGAQRVAGVYELVDQIKVT